jgi:glycosyltransferase involved in cell wall biosynthesis
MDNRPLVSILIPCYNAERWVGQAIDSALAQTWPNKEVIVVDDGSTDGSRAVIESYGDRIRYEFGPNRGGNAARNQLLDLAKGEWLQYLDADDYLLPDKITWQVGYIKKNDNTDIIYSPALFEEWVDNDTPLPIKSFPVPEPHDPWLHLARWRLPQTGGTLWRKNAIIKAGRWDEKLPCCQEHNLYFQLLKAGASFIHCPVSGAVYCYRMSPTVSRRDSQFVSKQRLKLLELILDFILQRKLATVARIHAINLTRFEIARTIWIYDRLTAQNIMAQVHLSERSFIPEGPASNFAYRWIYWFFGFQMAQNVADWTRLPRRWIN